ncbi:MAG: hypothetical protein C7B46_11675 [Sulfobacillus benefaciens]|uniref:Uncharacterized protein n=1 Tax=Sulfobacillus benefaciens TaxID=453960 RepID=A0A2T2XEW1_9FIRM|nr:MAG: hypothetical protein C7B46_11675 [Sulfobacillus benefaciens]
MLGLFKGSAVGQEKIRTVKALPLALVVALFPRGRTVGPHNGAPTVPTRLWSAEAIKGGKATAEGIAEVGSVDAVFDVDGLLGDPEGVAEFVGKEGELLLLTAFPEEALLGLLEVGEEIWPVRPHPVKMMLAKIKPNANTTCFVFITVPRSLSPTLTVHRFSYATDSIARRTFPVINCNAWGSVQVTIDKLSCIRAKESGALQHLMADLLMLQYSRGVL